MLDEMRAIEKDLTLRRLLRSGRGMGRKAVLAEPLGFSFTLLYYLLPCIGNRMGVRRDSWRGLADGVVSYWISSHPGGFYCAMNRLCPNPIC